MGFKNLLSDQKFITIRRSYVDLKKTEKTIFFQKHLFFGTEIFTKEILNKIKMFAENRNSRNFREKHFHFEKNMFWNVSKNLKSQNFPRPRKRTRIEKSLRAFFICIIKLVRVQWWGRSPTLSGRTEHDHSGAPDMTEQPGFPQWKSLYFNGSP